MLFEKRRKPGALRPGRQASLLTLAFPATWWAIRRGAKVCGVLSHRFEEVKVNDRLLDAAEVAELLHVPEACSGHGQGCRLVAASARAYGGPHRWGVDQGYVLSVLRPSGF